MSDPMRSKLDSPRGRLTHALRTHDRELRDRGMLTVPLVCLAKNARRGKDRGRKSIPLQHRQRHVEKILIPIIERQRDPPRRFSPLLQAGPLPDPIPPAKPFDPRTRPGRSKSPTPTGRSSDTSGWPTDQLALQPSFASSSIVYSASLTSKRACDSTPRASPTRLSNNSRWAAALTSNRCRTRNAPLLKGGSPR